MYDLTEARNLVGGADPQDPEFWLVYTVLIPPHHLD